MDRQRLELTLSWATLWRIFLVAALIVALYLAREVLVVLFLAIIISSAFDGPVSFLERKGLPRILSTLIVFLVVLGGISLVLYTVIPLSFFEFKSFIDNLSKVDLPVFGSLKLDASYLIQKLSRNLGDIIDALFSGEVSVFAVIAKIFGNIIAVITTVVLSFYLTVSRGGVEKFLAAVLPITYEDYAVGLYLRVRNKLGLWFQGQMILMFIVGAAVFLGLWLLGVKYSLVLAIMAGLLEIVPVVGPLFSGIVAFLIALSQSWLLALYAVALFFVIQQLENHLLVPLVMRKAVGISPVVVVVAILAGSAIAGVIGIILAVPMAVVFQEIIDDWERKKLRLKDNRLQI